MIERESGRGADATRIRILAAARSLFASRGSRGTTTRETAELAGVNEATLFRHFGSKHALLDAMREHYCGRARIEEAHAQRTGDLEADLRLLGAAVVAALEESADLIRISLGEETLDPDGCAATWRGPRDVHQTLIAYFGERTAAGELCGDPKDLARFFVGMLFAHVIPRKLWLEGRYPADRIVALCVGIFLNGVRPR